MIIKRLSSLIAGLLFVLTAGIYAGSYQIISDLGTSSALISRGGVYGFTPHADVLFENPASLKYVEGTSISAFATQLMEEVDYKTLSVAYRTEVGVFAVGYMSQESDDIAHTYVNDDDEYDVEYYFAFARSIMRGAYQYSLSQRLSLGAGINIYQDAVDSTTSSGWNMDAGVHYETENFGLSYSARNFLPNVVTFSGGESNGETEPLDLEHVLSGKANVWILSIYGQLKNTKQSNLVSGGVTAHIGSLLDLSAGNRSFAAGDRVVSSTTAGVGLNMNGIHLGYAYEVSDHVLYNSKHYFSVSFDF